MKQGLLRLSVLAVLATSVPDTAHAYIDPGSGSIALQMILAAIAGGVFYFREALGRFVGFFRRRDNDTPDD